MVQSSTRKFLPRFFVPFVGLNSLECFVGGKHIWRLHVTPPPTQKHGVGSRADPTTHRNTVIAYKPCRTPTYLQSFGGLLYLVSFFMPFSSFIGWFWKFQLRLSISNDAMFSATEDSRVYASLSDIFRTLGATFQFLSQRHHLGVESIKSI